MDTTTRAAEARERISRVFSYLTEYERLRAEPKRRLAEYDWVLRFSELPPFSTITIGTPPPSDEDPASGSGSGFALRIGRPRTTSSPAPPSAVRDWVLPGWERFPGSVERHHIRNRLADDETTITERFEDDPERVRTFTGWKLARDTWLQAERPARAALETYERLYRLRSLIEREGDRYRLLLADGHLVAERVDGRVDHPVLLQEVELQFDPSVPSFTIRETDAAAELYDELLSALPDLNPQSVAGLRRDLDDHGCHPLEQEATTTFLKHFVHALWSTGQFLDAPPQSEPTERPTMHRAPVVFLAPRTAGRLAAFKSFIEALAGMEEPPEPLARIVGIDLRSSTDDSGNGMVAERSGASSAVSDVDLLFTRPANPEQEAAVRSLESSGAVLVQGPPGTGKSHTIANLIGHLLARGKSVLVTSHTAKALRVVREKVAPELQDLCVSVIDSDLEGRKQLEVAIAGIVSKLSTGDRAAFMREATALGERRSVLRAEMRRAELDLLEGRRSEFDPIVVAGESIAPSDAAREVARGQGHDWIPGLLTPGASVPLDPGALLELYELTKLIAPADEAELTNQLPDLGGLPSADDYRTLLRQIDDLARDFNPRPDLWSGDGQDGAALEELELQAQRALDQLASLQPWHHHAVEAAANGGLHLEPWRQLAAILVSAPDEIARHRARLIRVDVNISTDGTHEDLLEACMEIGEYLRAGNTLGGFALFRRKPWKRLCEAARVDDRPPETANDFRAIESSLRIEVTRTQLAKRWDRQVAPLGGPALADLGQLPEVSARHLGSVLQAALDWPTAQWAPCRARLEGIGLRVDRLEGSPQGGMTATPRVDGAKTLLERDVIRALRSRRRELALRALQQAEDALREKLGSSEASLTVIQLRRALRDRDSTAYQAARDRLEHLHRLRRSVERRGVLLGAISKVAPAWEQQLATRSHPTSPDGGIPGDPIAAWLHRQWTQELDRRGQVSLDRLQRKVTDTRSALLELTAKYVERLAWAHQVGRTSLSQQQALVGYSDLIRRIGRAKGRRAPRLKREANRLLSECRSAVPVWIMPLGRVLESFDPRISRFDVVIVDEASQCDISGLAALGLGRQVVVVGDNEQVSPLAVGQKLDRIEYLIEQFLQGIPNRLLYDGKYSIYDLGNAAFGTPIRLEEHFRSVPEIIAFSNHLSYQGRIRPLREESAAPLRPFVIGHRVRGGHEVDKVNYVEAEEVASLLVASAEQPEYRTATMGVISLLGDQQAARVDEILQRALPPADYERRRIVCGSAAHFQGDERDVMFLSMVWSPGEGPLPMNQRDEFKQRLNVAASRARDQMWIVHSVDPELDLKPGDLRRRLIEHALDPAALKRLSEEVGKAESDFEKQVLARLAARGYRIVSQWRVGAYRIDIVVIGQEGRVAIECDGDRFHTLDELERDLARQAVLERMGWRFIRIRGSKFYRTPDATMDDVFARLFQLEIEPIGPSAAPSPAADDDELRRRVVRRAEELRLEWGGKARVEGSPNAEPRAARTPGEQEAVAAQSRSEPSQGAPHVTQPASPDQRVPRTSPATAEILAIEELERGAIEQALRRTKGDKQEAARLLGIDRSTLYRKLKRYGLDPDDPADGGGPGSATAANPPEQLTTPSPRVTPSPPPATRTIRAPGAGADGTSSVVTALMTLAPEIRTVMCERCGTSTTPRISDKGLALRCDDSKCRAITLVATALLQQVSDLLGASCFQCEGQLQSRRGPFGSFLKCMKCGTNNSWSGVATRLGIA